MRILFMGTPDFALVSLQTLVEAEWDVVGVVTQPDRPAGRGRKMIHSPIKTYALEKNLPIYQPNRASSKHFVNTIKDIQPDLIVVVAYGHILKKRLIQIPPKGVINVHASLLPKYRGAAPIQWAIAKGETETGVTTFYIDEGMDTGDIILQRSIAIGADETAGQLHDRLANLGAEVLLETVQKIANNTAPRIPQDHESATVCCLLTKDDGKIDWTISAAEIYNHIRGMTPWPGAFTNFKSSNDNEITFKIFETEVAHDLSETDQPPGTIIDVYKGGIFVQTGAGILRIKTLQPPNRRKMNVEEYLAGHDINIGDRMV